MTHVAAGQLDLLAGPPRPTWARGSGIDDAWWGFHERHPEVYEALAHMAHELLRQGHRHLGIAMLWEALRYTTMLGAAPGESPFRLNNVHRSRYARLLMERDERLTGVFETRELRSQQ